MQEHECDVVPDPFLRQASLPLQCQMPIWVQFISVRLWCDRF